MALLKEVVVTFPPGVAVQVQRTMNGIVLRSAENFTVYSHPEADVTPAGASYPNTKTLDATEILAALTNP